MIIIDIRYIPMKLNNLNTLKRIELNTKINYREDKILITDYSIILNPLRKNSVVKESL